VTEVSLDGKYFFFPPLWLEPRVWPNPGQLRGFRRLAQREDDRLGTMACHSVYYIILRAASVTFLGVGPLRPKLQSGLERTMEKKSEEL